MIADLARSTSPIATAAVVEREPGSTVNERGRSGYLMIKLATVGTRMTVMIDTLLLLLKLATRKSKKNEEGMAENLKEMKGLAELILTKMRKTKTGKSAESEKKRIGNVKGDESAMTKKSIDEKKGMQMPATKIVERIEIEEKKRKEAAAGIGIRQGSQRRMEQRTVISEEMMEGRKKKTVGKKVPSGTMIGMIVKKTGGTVVAEMGQVKTTMERSLGLQENLTRTENMLLERDTF
mmetsp:Transcript_44681/g.93524  ORF Transcript_44681/g.93524 Transcript_44681/m.93524 type:complete len:236 (+) Transcript_44681:273-980(+)